MPHTAIVILCFNNRKYLQQFLPGVVAHSPGAEVVIVDNASTDDTLAFLAENYPGLRVIELPINFGFCEGYNQALRQIKADYYLLLNSDVEVTEGWLQPLVSVLDSNDQVGACQPKILSYAEPEKFEYAGAGGGYIDALGYPFCRGRIFQTLEIDTGQYNDERPVFWATGACMLVRATLYHQLGGLEKFFFAHMEEIDLCWRLQRAGFLVYYSGLSKVYHVGGGTLQQDSPRKTYLNFRNNQLLLLRNVSLWRLVWLIPVRMALDWLAAVQFLVAGKPANAMAVLRAHVAVLQAMGQLNEWRSKGKVAGPYKALLTGVFRGSIVWEYFIRGKRTFPELHIPNGAFLPAQVPAQVHQESQAQVNDNR